MHLSVSYRYRSATCIFRLLPCLGQLNQRTHVDPAATGIEPWFGFVAEGGPAMSMWVQGVSPTKFSRNFAAVIAPPQRPLPTFLMSAMLPWISSLNSGNIGRGQSDSPAVLPAVRTACCQISSLLITPATSSPSATQHAPVSVARSTILLAPCSRATSSTSARTKRLRRRCCELRSSCRCGRAEHRRVSSRGHRSCFRPGQRA